MSKVMPQTQRLDKIERQDTALQCVFVLFCLYGNYSIQYHVRPFDILGLFFLVLFTFYYFRYYLYQCEIPRQLLIFVTCTLGYLIFLVVFMSSVGGVSTIIAFFLGLYVFILYAILHKNMNAWYKLLTIILILLVAVFFLQVIVYYLFKKYLFLVIFRDSDARVWWLIGNKKILRASTFFMEPNQLSMFITLLLSLRYAIRKKYDIVSYLSILIMILSLSLWGIVIGICFLLHSLVVTIRSSKNSEKFLILTLLILGLIGGLLFVQYLAKELPKDNFLNVTVFSRAEKVIYSIEHPGTKESESSYNVRYAKLATIMDNPFGYNFWFGHGLNSYKFQSFGGANGISFLIYSFGLVGTLILMLLTIYLFSYNLYALFWIFVSMLSYPMFTNFIWWAWLALIYTALSKQTRKPYALSSS